jgi:hypothetical protein
MGPGNRGRMVGGNDRDRSLLNVFKIYKSFCLICIPIQPLTAYVSKSKTLVRSEDFTQYRYQIDRLCGLVVRFPAYRSRGPGTTRFSEKLWVWKGVHSAS